MVLLHKVHHVLILLLPTFFLCHCRNFNHLSPLQAQCRYRATEPSAPHRDRRPIQAARLFFPAHTKGSVFHPLHVAQMVLLYIQRRHFQTPGIPHYAKHFWEYLPHIVLPLGRALRSLSQYHHHCRYSL